MCDEAVLYKIKVQLEKGDILPDEFQSLIEDLCVKLTSSGARLAFEIVNVFITITSKGVDLNDDILLTSLT